MKRISLLLLIFIFATTTAQTISKTEKIDQLVKKYNEYGFFNGSVLVSEGGNVIYKKGIGMANFEWNIPNTTDTKFRLGSITKQFTAVIILKLVEMGKLRLDQKITDILPDYPKKTGDKVTIHHLLTHTSGIPNYTDFPGFMHDVRLRTVYTTEDLLDLFKDRDLDFEPGSTFSYSNSGYLVLGAIIEKVTHDTYENILRKYVLEPAGMTNTGYDHFETVISKRAAGYDKTPLGYRNSTFIDMTVPFSAGAIYSTVEDLYKWDQILYTDKLISEESKKKMFTPYTPAFGSGFYGYGWNLSKLPVNDKGDSTSVIAHGGGIPGFNGMILREPGLKNLIVLLNNTPGANLNELASSISNILFDLKYQMPKRAAVDLIAETVREKGINEATAQYKQLKKDHPDDYIFNERNLNDLGYDLIRNNNLSGAAAIFKLAVEEYPNSANVYDSYGEALLAGGDTARAIDNYKISIDKNPGNEPAIALLKKLKVDITKKEIKIDPEILKGYTGNYQLTPNFIITVSVDNDKLFIQATGQPKLEIYPKTETNFYLTVVNAQIDFVKGDNGKIGHLILHQNGQDMKANKIN